MKEIIRRFTSSASIPVTYTFDRTPFTGRIREVRSTVEYKDRTIYRSSDEGYGFAGGFVLGTMF